MTDINDRTAAFMILDKLRKDAGLQYHEVLALEYAVKVLKVETETCKFNCRTSKEAYITGYADGYLVEADAYHPLQAYEEYCREQRLG